MKKLGRVFVLLLAMATAGTVFGSAPASADYADGSPSNVWEINGTYVYDITRIGDRIYVGGLFSGVFSPQSVATSQPNLVAFDANTGVYDPTFAPSLDGLVQSVEPSADGSVLYVGGAFGTVNGATHRGVVALDPVTGATIPGFSASIDAGRTVHDIEVDGNDLYIGGDFFTIGGVNNPRVARIDATTGAVDVPFRPAPNNLILDMSIPPAGDRLYIGGTFDALDGVATKKMVALSLPSGALDPTFEHGFNARVRAIESTDDRVVVADRGPNRIRLSDTAGNQIALISGDGDFQDLELVGRRVIVGSHSTSLNGDPAYSRLQAFHLADGAISTTFTTEVLAWPGVFTTYASGQDLWVGGKYYKIGTTFRKKLARIQTEAGQTGPSQPLNLVATTPAANQVGLSWTASTDDTGILGYRILKGASQVDFVTAGTSWVDTSNDVGVTHQYHVEAVDLDDNVSQRSDAVLMAATDGTDTEAPTVPEGLLATTVGEDAIDLAWTESFDLVGVDHYDIFRDGVEVGSVTHPVVTFSDTGLLSSTEYSYEVRAVDAADNESALSTALAVTTLDESEAPTAPTAVTVTGATQDSVSLSWTASTDNVGVASYEIVRDGVAVGTVDDPAVTFTDTGLAVDTTYSYVVRAYDAIGNVSPDSAPAVDGTTTGDTELPSAPGVPTLASATGSSISLTWAASTDNVGVDHYDIVRGGVVIGSTADDTAAFTDDDGGAGLAEATSYDYEVRAVDAAGNVSADSPTGSLSTLDATAPSVPTALTVTGVTADSVSLSWTASTDNIAVASYEVLRDAVVVGTVTAPAVTFTDTGLTEDTAYSYTVRALDAVPNTSAESTATIGTTSVGPDVTPPSVPADLAVTGVTQSSVSLSWTASTDNVAVVSYEVLRDAVVVGTVAAPAVTFTDTGLVAGTDYSYTVRALDAIPNTSAESAAVIGTTAADTVAPNGTVTSPTHNEELDTTPVTVTGNATDDIGVVSANLSIRNLTVGDPNYLQWLQTDLTTWGNYKWLPATLVTPGATDTDFSLDVLLSDGDYGMQLTARDLAGNTDPTRPWVKFSIDTGPPDAELPLGFIDAPTDNQQLTGTTHTFSGTATDNVGVEMVQIIIKDVVNNTFLRSDGSFGSYQRLSTTEGTPGAVSTTWTADYDLPVGSYWVKVVAFDAAGNLNQPKPRNDFDVN